MRRKTTIAVVGLEDGPESCAGPGLLAALAAQRFTRVAVACRAGESGAFRLGAAEHFERAGDVRTDEHAFVARLAEIVARRRVDVLLAGSPLVAQVIGCHAKELERAGAQSFGPDSAALVRLREKGLRAPRRSDRYTIVPSIEIPALPAIANFLAAPAWPVAFFTDNGLRRRAIDAQEAAAALRALRERGARQVRMASPALRRTFEACLVVARSGALLCSCSVRVVEDDDRLRPWLAVTVDDPELERVASAAAGRCGLCGPVVVTLQAEHGGFAVLDVQPGFPVWIEACLRDGPNLVESAVVATLDARARAVGRVPAGTLFSQTANDIVVDPRSPAAKALLS